MICKICEIDFEEGAIEESHDVPCYLFEGNRKGQKNQADKHGRHYICRECHRKYENKLRIYLRMKAKEFAKIYFKVYFERDDKNGESISEI